jgi:hypothetical protein
MAKKMYLHETCLTILYGWQNAKHTASGFHLKPFIGVLDYSKNQNIF